MFTRIFVILIILTITVVYSFYQKRSIEFSLSDSTTTSLLTKLPSESFVDLNNQDYNILNSNVDSSLVVVHFWGTWCAPCESELPDLITFIKSFNNSTQIKFFLIAVNDDPVKVKKRLQAFKGVDITWLLDSNNVFKDKYGSTRVPETYVFSSEGFFLKKFLGPQEWTRDHYGELFQEFLSTSLKKL
jgi:thiol-disulfide isomerase/thioredoxin